MVQRNQRPGIKIERIDIYMTMIPHQRLANQHISGHRFQRPEQVVQWLGAVQAQDYLGALWGVGLRMEQATEAAVEQTLTEGAIVRTWPMRGTLHFVAAADIRWMLELMTPRIVAASKRRLEQQFDLDEKTFSRSRELFVRELQGGRRLERNQMYQMLEQANISAAGQRGLHILWRLAQEGVICFGPRQGKQQTFVLLDEWVPNPRRLERDEALAELAGRYFTSRGPATLQDFTWWSGLTSIDAKAGIEMARPEIIEEKINDRTYWLAPSQPDHVDPSPTAYLLPAYDEYTVAYKDRSAVLDPLHAADTNSGNGIFKPTIVVDGQVVGVWKRTLERGSVLIATSMFRSLTKAEQLAVDGAAERYKRFLEETPI